MRTYILADDRREAAIVTEALHLIGAQGSTVSVLDQLCRGWEADPGDSILLVARLSDPVAAVRTIRHTMVAPLIVVQDPLTEQMHMALLEAGADIVLARPYSVLLLMGYVRALQRRAGSVFRQSLPMLQLESVQLDPSSRTVRIDSGQPQRLSQLEFRLLHTLMVHRGQVLPTETLVEHVWGYTGEGDRSMVRGLVNRLRAKIEPNPHAPAYIHTVSGVGYLFGENPEL